MRPGHADYTGNIRYSGFNDLEVEVIFRKANSTLSFAGAICKQILECRGIYIAPIYHP